MPRQCHVATVGSGTFFKQNKICKDVFQTFFYKDGNQNAPKLQGRKSYLTLFFYYCFRKKTKKKKRNKRIESEKEKERRKELEREQKKEKAAGLLM